MAGLGTGVDDFPAVTLFLKGLNRRLDAPDHPFDVDVVDFVDNLRGNGLDRRGWRHAGVVDDDVEAAQRFARLFDGGKYLVAVGDIHFHRHGAAAGLVDFGGDRFGGGVVIIGNGHGKSILHQTKGDSFTNPLAGAGNKCDFFHFPFLIVMTYRI